LRRGSFLGGLGHLGGAEARVIFEGHLQEWRFHLRVFQIGNLIVADLEGGELLDHFGKRERHFAQIRGRHFTGEEFRRLLVDGTEENSGPTGRHAAFNFGGLQKHATFRIDRSGFQDIVGDTRYQIGQEQTDRPIRGRSARGRFRFHCDRAIPA
jgi:hypothetical protein